MVNKQLKTILFHIPLLLFQYFAILSFTQKDIEYKNLNYFEPLGLSIFILMIILTAYMSYNLKSIHKYIAQLYLLVVLFTPTFVGLFDNHIVSSIIPFLIYCGVFFYIDKIKKSFNITGVYIKDNSEHLIKEFDKDFEARNFLRYIVEEKLKEFCHKTNNERELIDVYFKTRDFTYNIENDHFNEDEYVKVIALRVYNQFLNSTIDGGFEKFNKKEELILLNDIEDSDIISINEKDKFIEIAYKKVNEEKYLTIEQTSLVSSKEGIASFFILDNKKLQDIKISKNFSDINKIIKVFHLVKFNDYEVDFRKDILEIIYKNSENKINSYRLTINFDYEEGVDLSIQKYEDIFSFETRVLADKNNTQLLYSYDQKYFCPKMEYNYFEEVYDESQDYENLSPQITRKTIRDYSYDFPVTTFGKKIRFMVGEDGGIKAYNISHFHLSNPLCLPSKEIYDYLNENEKKKLHHFLAIAQLYINDLYVNREFESVFILDSFTNTKEDEKVDKLLHILQNSNWIKKWYYDNAEQGHQASMLVDIYYHENDKNKRFVVFNENDWIDAKITIKYNNDIQNEVEELLKAVM